MTHTEADALANQIGALPPMPRAAARVLALIDDPEAGAGQIGRVIETDPALAAAVLRLVNSALFGLSQHVASLSHALVLIGFLRLRSLMLATVAAGLKDAIPSVAAEARERVWEHSVCTGLAAKALAQRAGVDWVEEAFAAGLLHDCGRLVLLARKTNDYVRLLDESKLLPTPERETSALGIDHAELGGALLAHWNQAVPLVEAVRSHHDDGPPKGPLQALVILADRLLDGSGRGVEPCPASEILGFKAEDLPELAVVLQDEVAEARKTLMAL